MVVAINPISHWYHLIEGFQTSGKEFYQAVEQAVQKHEIPNAKIERVDWKEGGLLSAKREYLRVRRKDFVFDICAAPFGKDFFFSWWMGEIEHGFWGRLFRRFSPVTYFKLDTAQMFQEAIRLSVLEIIDQLTKAQGVRALTEDERKPVLRDFYQQ